MQERELLRQRADAFEHDVETALVDERGLVRSALNLDTMRPFERGYFDDKHVHRYPGATWDDFADYMAYENVGMCSGAYLAAMTWKYRAVRDPAALALARRTLAGIRWLFDLSQPVEEGFYCKCYGGRLSDQVSSDQYIYTFAGMDTFLEFADAAERRGIYEMLAKMVRWWIRRQYTYPYFGRPLCWQLARFPAFSWLAWHHTRQPAFREEFDRLCALPEVRNQLPFMVYHWEDMLETTVARDPAFDFETDSGKRLLRVSPECTESGFVSTEPLLEYGAPHRELWLAKVRRMYDVGRRWIADDGYALGPHLMDIETGAITEVRELLSSGAQIRDGWRFFGHVGWIRSGMWSAMFARAAVGIHRFCPDLDGLDIARRILSQLDRSKLRWFVDMDGKQLPDDMRWMDRTYSGDAVTHWLWAYWEDQARHGAVSGVPHLTGGGDVHHGGTS